MSRLAWVSLVLLQDLRQVWLHGFLLAGWSVDAELLNLRDD
jgi:hypothetical protein